MSRNRVSAYLVVSAALVLLPSPAYANGVIALFDFGIVHMLLGNLTIGVLEGIVLSWIYKMRIGAAIGTMILANYFSDFEVVKMGTVVTE